MDQFDVEILADGTVKSSSGPVSPENHQSAEAFLKSIADKLGGATARRRRGDAVEVHTHAHGEAHHTH